MYGFDNLFPYTDFHEMNLDFLLKRMKELSLTVEDIHRILVEYVDSADKFMELYNALLNGDFPPGVIQAFNSWMQDNALDLVGDLVKMVFFGLNDDGYFVAFIPESWKDIQFSTTGLDDFPPGISYGHLTLSY